MKNTIIVVLLALAVFVPSQAQAHQSSFSYASLMLDGDGKAATYDLRLSTRDLFEALELRDDRDASDAEIIAGQALLLAYVFDRVRLEVPDNSCTFTPTGVEVLVQGERFARASGRLECSRPITTVDLSYDLFFDLDPSHEGLLRIDGQLVQFSEGEREFRYETGQRAVSGVTGFLRSGVHHVLSGLDHILFLVALLLVVCLQQVGRQISTRSPTQCLRQTAGIVTAFTLGHSITLIVAALGWFELSSRFVESMIAASIIYVAIENILRPDPKHRALITFAFGLMHGLGFAAMLRPLLPPDETVLPLLVFNVGVELGQLAIVAVALPALYLAIRAVKATHYRRFILPVGCTALSALGAVWLLERALEVTIIGL